MYLIQKINFHFKHKPSSSFTHACMLNKFFLLISSFSSFHPLHSHNKSVLGRWILAIFFKPKCKIKVKVNSQCCLPELLTGEFVNKLVFWIFKATRCFTSEALHAPSQLHRKSCLMRENLNFFVMNLHHNNFFMFVSRALLLLLPLWILQLKLTCLWK